MTLRHLKIFIAVAETKSMSAAARRCFITQPTVSQTIHELEEHYHTILFERLSASFTSQKPERIFSPMPGR